MKTRFFIYCFCFLGFVSCGKTRFVAKMHNDIVEEFKTNGTLSYMGKEYEIIAGSTYNCILYKEFEKLHTIVPNVNFNIATCRFYIDYQYINKMKEFVVNNGNEKQKKKLIEFSEEDYIKTKEYHDSLWIDKHYSDEILK